MAIKLLFSLRDLQRPATQALDIPPLDKLIQTSSRPCIRPSRSPVIELSSEPGGGGKTHLLYLAIAITILPPIKLRARENQQSYQTRNAACAVVFDADGNFDVCRLAQIMRHLLIKSPARSPNSSNVQAGNEQSNEDQAIETESALVESTVLNALRHVHIFRPQTLDSLIATVQSLPDYLFDFSQHQSSSRALELICIDSITAFYWQEKMAEEIAKWDAGSEEDQATTPRPERQSGYALLAHELRGAQKQFDCPIIATSWGLKPVAGPQAQQRAGLGSRLQPSFTPLLPPAWQNFISLRLGVGRAPVKKFAAGMSLEQAEKDKDAREKVVGERRFCCWVDLWGVEGGGSGARKGGECEFRIGDEGVEMD